MAVLDQRPTARQTFLGAPLDPITRSSAVAMVDEAIRSRSRLRHVSVNAAKVVALQNDELLSEAIWSFDFSTADGQAVVWAARLLGKRVPERVAGIDLMEEVLQLADDREYTLFLLGAGKDVVEAAKASIEQRNRHAKVVGTQHGYFDPKDEAAIVDVINAANPDIVLVALPTPQKEFFLARHNGTLRAPFAMGVGGALEILAGRRTRAPRWIQKAGLEWLFRLLQEPRRLARRYVSGNARFVGLVAREALERRGQRRIRR